MSGVLEGLMLLQGKGCLVTGAGSGIGATVARVFAMEGADLAICGRGMGELEDVRAQIAEAGGRVLVVPTDLTSKSDIGRLVARIRERLGVLDVLVNNAGILGAHTPLARYPDDEWDTVLGVNLTAVFHLTKAVLPFMRDGGSIISVSSSVGRVGRAGWGAYAVSKFGMEGFSQVLLDELRERKIRVNTVNPGGTRTAMCAAAYPDEDPTSVPPEHVTPIFVYLACDLSTGLTGGAFNAREWRMPLETTQPLSS